MTWNLWWIIAFSITALLGLYFFIRIRKHFLQTKNLPNFESSFPLSDKKIVVDEFEINYTTHGSGDPILLLHGIGASIYCWRLLIPFLKKKYKVISLDLPGFGQSTKIVSKEYGLDDQSYRVIHFLDSLSIRKTHIVGCSMGGAIGLWLKRNYPDRVGKLVTINPAADSTLVPLSLSYISRFTNTLKTVVTESFTKQIMKLVFFNKDLVNKDTIKNYFSPYKNDEDSIKTFIKAIELLRDKRLPSELSNISDNFLILHGEKDKLVPLRSIKKIQRHCPKAVILPHPKAGHHIQEDDPYWTFQKIHNFINTTDVE